jgi:phosphoribosylamine--glycine ligase
MRCLGIGDSCDLGALYLRLIAEGHEVRVHVANPLCHGTLAGLVTRVEDWKQQLDWVRDAGDEGIILFENVAERRGALQDDLRRDGFNVIGGSAYGDRLENNRGFAQEVLRDIGLSICPVRTFSDRAQAMRFIEARPAPLRARVQRGLRNIRRTAAGRPRRARLPPGFAAAGRARELHPDGPRRRR